MPNVFISHRGTDAKEAERLARELVTAGHQVWLDEWNIGIGDSVVGRINEGLEGATYLVICYSKAGINVPWMGREWMSGLARKLNGHAVVLLPVILTGGSAPPILADLKYADLSTNWTSGLAELLRAIK